MRIFAHVGLAALGALLVGCYTLQPAQGVVPRVGTEMAFDINDAGRLALGGTMGPEIAQIEGRLIERDSGDYVVAVSALRLLRGGEQVWRGERVRLKSEYVASLYEKRLSAGRSIAMGAAGVAAVAMVVGRSIIGSGSPEPGRLPPDTGVMARIPRP